MNKSYIVDYGGDVHGVETRNHRPANALVEIPGDIVSADHPYVKAMQQADPETGEQVWVTYIDGSAKTTAETAATKKQQQDTAYANMIEDVYSNLFDVFRTRKPETATAEYETWKHMKDNAALYVGAGLKCGHQLDNADETELFSAGSALDTEQKILDYATRKIEQAHVYGVYRAQRIQAFKDELAAI